MKNICKIFAIILFLLGSVLVTFAQKAFNFQPDATVIINDSVVIRLNDYDGVIQWQKSSDLQLWDNIPGATQDTLLFVADTTTYFRAEVIAGDCDPFFSDTTLLHVVETGVTDIDGNFYPSVIIGNQEWMAENLRVTRDADGNTITRYCYDDEENNCVLYGGLYTWQTIMNGSTGSNTNPSNVQGICPAGWQVPSEEQWTELVNYIAIYGFPNSNVVYGAGNALKSCRQANHHDGGDCATSEHPRWDSHSTHYGMDEFGFSALPGGIRETGGSYSGLGYFSIWWTSTERVSPSASNSSLRLDSGRLGYYDMGKEFGFSVRCVRVVENDEPNTYNLNLHISPEGSGQVSLEGEYIEGATVYIAASPIANNQFVNWSGDTEFIVDSTSATTLLTMPAMDVYLTANFETSENNIQYGEGVTDIDGNFYPSIIIGNQEWMAENLRVGHDANGNEINRFCFNNDTLNCELYGGLYTWQTMIQGAGNRSNNSGNVQGICPTGWHVPSHDEWTQLEQHVCNFLGNESCSDQFPYNTTTVGYLGTNEARIIKSCRQISSPLGGDCATSEHPRWDPFHDHYGWDGLGFSALPAGYMRIDGLFLQVGYITLFWSSTEMEEVAGWTRTIGAPNSTLGRYAYNKSFGLSVRCVRDTD